MVSESQPLLYCPNKKPTQLAYMAKTITTANDVSAACELHTGCYLMQLLTPVANQAGNAVRSIYSCRENRNV